MVKIKGPFKLNGSIAGISFYTMRGSDKVIMRTKGGASKEKIKNLPQFAGLRKQQKEWSGCTQFGSLARYSFGGLHRVADINLTPELNRIGKRLAKLDTVSPVGQRSIKLSEYKEFLEGFDFNKDYPINTVLRVLPRWEIDRDQLKGVVTFPRINTDINLLNIQKLPFFRLVIAIGTVSDIIYDPDKEAYFPLVSEVHGYSSTLTGEWNSAKTILPEQTMTVQMEEQVSHMTDNVTVLLTMAVEFGNIGDTKLPVEVKYAGCGKVIGVK